MIFVAQPYFSLDQEIIDQRVKIGSIYCGALLNKGIMCVSPVALATTILNHVKLPGDFSYWDKISFSLLEKSDEIHILTIDGWDKSRGVSEEIKRATELGIPIKYIDVDECQQFIVDSKIEIK